MSCDADSLELLDPICGGAVAVVSPYRCVQGGALFCFCGDACLARFVTDPSRFAVSAVLGGIRSAPAAADSTSVESGPDTFNRDIADTVVMPRDVHPTDQGASAPTLDGPAPPATDFRAETGEHSADAAATTAEVAHPPTTPAASQAALGEHKRLAPFLAWRERHFAAACCRELLALHRTLADKHPELSRFALYLQIVMTRSGVDAAAAQAMLQSAEDSFASWPVSRDLNFRDVVHYLAVSEFLGSHGDSHWIRANLKHVVDSSIPHEL